jgi:cation:H+ antiporter
VAAKFGIPNIVIGLTIVAFGTSSPELFVNVFASVKGSNDLVLGNVIGSNLFNVLFILGVCALISPLVVKSNTNWIEIPLSLLAALTVIFMSADFLFDGNENSIVRSEGLVLLLFFSIFLVYNFYISKKENSGDEITKLFPTWKSLLFIVGGLAGLVIGGRLIVQSAVEIATKIGMSERTIGLTIVSIGTSLPELATSVVAVRKKNVDIAIGNVVGSNIFNIFLILGVSATINPVTVSDFSIVDTVLNAFASLLLFVFLFTGKGRRLERWEGIIFLLIYVAYLVYLIRFQ